ncbi:MAG: oxygen-independent coproporphyrinogen III oxidase [Ekhidna sp.]|uniref:oxygen-independent coproporphyrinogen III oxidase n=1 Tax=Ekhidna sp. TaxID=2608089 RepID=UPI0032EC6CA3
MPDLRKYNIPVPRYTSYPTVPFWEPESFTIEAYERTLQSAFWESSKEVSIYIHLPFCESLCTYCACNTRITKNHQVEDPYIDYLLKEWELYLEKLPEKPLIREIHLGGGTPTFFAPENLNRLLSGIIERASLSKEFQMSFEGHPANTTSKHLETLHDIGFDRVSFGIQDFDLNVQKLINRMQSFEQVKAITEKAREIGYTSVNYDVVYGLPGQTVESVQTTLDQIIQLKPERIAYYSYAHVPSMRPAQKSYEAYLPDEDHKWEFMHLGKDAFLQAGYEEVGMDHYVMPGDELLEARRDGELHRNFMGYTPFTSKLLIGLGASSISDSWSGFAQNEKSIPKYYEMLDQGRLPIVKGHIHTRQDLFFRKHILNLMCNFETTWHESEFLEYCVALNYDLLDQLQEEGLILYGETGMKVLPEGREVIRVICTGLDAKLNGSNKSPKFSQAI